MDFIEGLPPSHGFNSVWVIVHRLTKYSHFIPIIYPYIAKMIAQLFTKHILKLHGMSNFIVFDHDSTFIKTPRGVQLAFNAAYHPQSDGQSKIVNKCVENFLRCYAGDRPRDLSQWVPLAEWWYNTTQHSSTRITPFQALYGNAPPKLISYIPGLSKVDAVEESLQTREYMNSIFKHNIQRA